MQWNIGATRDSNGLTENDGHENDGHEIGGQDIYRLKIDYIINQSINLFVMKHSTRDIAVTAMTGTTRLKSTYGSPK